VPSTVRGRVPVRAPRVGPLAAPCRDRRHVRPRSPTRPPTRQPPVARQGTDRYPGDVGVPRLRAIGSARVASAGFPPLTARMRGRYLTRSGRIGAVRPRAEETRYVLRRIARKANGFTGHRVRARPDRRAHATLPCAVPRAAAPTTITARVRSARTAPPEPAHRHWLRHARALDPSRLAGPRRPHPW